MRALIAEDSVLLREGIARLLTDAGLEVVARVGDGQALLTAIEELRPDVSIVDVRMPPNFLDEGLRAAIEARRRVPGSRIVVLSQYVEERYATELIASGAEGVGTCSRIAWRMSTISSRRFARWPAAAQSSIQRSSPNSLLAAVAAIDSNR